MSLCDGMAQTVLRKSSNAYPTLTVRGCLRSSAVIFSHNPSAELKAQPLLWEWVREYISPPVHFVLSRHRGRSVAFFFLQSGDPRGIPSGLLRRIPQGKYRLQKTNDSFGINGIRYCSGSYLNTIIYVIATLSLCFFVTLSLVSTSTFHLTPIFF